MSGPPITLAPRAKIPLANALNQHDSDVSYGDYLWVQNFNPLLEP